jgi:hypothetical protein
MKKQIAIMFMAAVMLPMFLQGLDICPENMQAVLVLKIIPFTKNFDVLANSEITIGVFKNEQILEHFSSASKKMTFKIRLISIQDTSISLEKVNILYIPKGTNLAAVEALNKQAKKYGVLTVTGDPDAALERNVTLSFYVSNESPKILVNMRSAKEEGINFSGKVLGLADVRNVDK